MKRLIYDMRLYLDAPIINKPGHGYYYAKNTAFELPGIWFSADELHALLTIELIAGLFGKSVSTVNGHIKNIYVEQELVEAQSMKKFGNSEFARKSTNYDTIQTVGHQGNKANKGFVLDQKRFEVTDWHLKFWEVCI